MRTPSPLFPAALLLAALASQPLPARAQSAAPPALQTYVAQPDRAAQGLRYEARVEAVRQTTLAAQVAGAVVQLDVRPGDAVKAGQLLMRLDARSADQNAQASEAQAGVARAQLDLARRELDRQQQLFRQHFISQAALDQTEAQFKATQAQVQAQLAQAGAARSQSAWYQLRAPYAGVIAEVPVVQGDMALPGRSLAVLYDPTALRVTAHVPQAEVRAVQAALDSKDAGIALVIDLPALGVLGQAPRRVQWLPTVDGSSGTVELRADLPSPLTGQLQALVPGQFAQVRLVGPSAEPGRAGVLTVPAQAVVRRAEMTGLYVLNAEGRPLLRQVRLGELRGGQIEILSGLRAGERVALEPQVAARVR
ncbi:efflux RND transporter periplasmic adaptor subunit [Pelomonas sp. APW6]|uniref:Efflux RND transporter periplasmic adaptor subunit n=1 Tax=Roseateles subflavus TaxID=3053353 RepID=A0ABT7LPB4_9BURK|nr:efflux RND transporter periplasmic adaptor subunit [Pelomonas sp. APW6]MDL5034077.1 efflux RND transporter periplasmic adaptor subunit [Pelomonas sp. APW6]